MKNILKIFSFALVCVVCFGAFVACGETECSSLKLEAYSNTEKGYSIDNSGVSFSCVGDNTYEIGGTISEASESIKSAFGFKDNEKYIVSLKLQTDKEVDKDDFSIVVVGPSKTNTFDKSALDGENYTYLLLAVDEMTSEVGYKITVKWNGEDKEETYLINRADDFSLKNN